MRFFCELQMKDNLRRQLLVRELRSYGITPKVSGDLVVVEYVAPLEPKLFNLIRLIDAYSIDERAIILTD